MRVQIPEQPAPIILPCFIRTYHASESEGPVTTFFSARSPRNCKLLLLFLLFLLVLAMKGELAEAASGPAPRPITVAQFERCVAAAHNEPDAQAAVEIDLLRSDMSMMPGVDEIH
jgi:hypothetical protein